MNNRKVKNQRKEIEKVIYQAAKDCGFESFQSRKIEFDDLAFRQIFLSEGCEPITAKVVHEKLLQGMPEEDIQFLIDNDFVYCRPRDSFLQRDEKSGAIFEKGKKCQIHFFGN